MANINQTSVREELDRLKGEFTRLSSEQAVSGEIKMLMSGMLTLLELICAIFLEKKTVKNNKNSSKPSSQTDKDESALDRRTRDQFLAILGPGPLFLALVTGHDRHIVDESVISSIRIGRGQRDFPFTGFVRDPGRHGGVRRRQAIGSGTVIRPARIGESPREAGDPHVIRRDCGTQGDRVGGPDQDGFRQRGEGCVRQFVDPEGLFGPGLRVIVRHPQGHLVVAGDGGRRSECCERCACTRGDFGCAGVQSL